MRTRRQKIQLELALEPVAKGEARSAGEPRDRSPHGACRPRTPAQSGRDRRWRRPVQPGKLKKALARVRRNPGGARCRRHDDRRSGRSPEKPLARDQVSAPRWHLRTAAGAAGGDPEGIGRRSPARRADRESWAKGFPDRERREGPGGTCSPSVDPSLNRRGPSEVSTWRLHAVCPIETSSLSVGVIAGSKHGMCRWLPRESAVTLDDKCR